MPLAVAVAVVTVEEAAAEAVAEEAAAAVAVATAVSNRRASARARSRSAFHQPYRRSRSRYRRTSTPTRARCATPSRPTGTWTTAGQPTACIIVGDDITIAADVYAHGTNPLVLAAVHHIDLDAVLDVSSHAGSATNGAGNDPTVCPELRGEGSAGCGGGAGGSFTTEGGSGGGVATTRVRPVACRRRCPPCTPTVLYRGGCHGENGNTDGNGSAHGGVGGGAVYLAAGSVIDLGSAAAIDASGAGGGIAGQDQTGGGRGGAGGMIVLEAPVIGCAGHHPGVRERR